MRARLWPDRKENSIGMEVLAEEEGVECEADVVVDTMRRGTNMAIHYSLPTRSKLYRQELFEGTTRVEE